MHLYVRTTYQHLPLRRGPHRHEAEQIPLEQRCAQCAAPCARAPLPEAQRGVHSSGEFSSRQPPWSTSLSLSLSLSTYALIYIYIYCIYIYIDMIIYVQI